jgi:uncharacterized membrane protein
VLVLMRQLQRKVWVIGRYLLADICAMNPGRYGAVTSMLSCCKAMLLAKDMAFSTHQYL